MANTTFCFETTTQKETLIRMAAVDSKKRKSFKLSIKDYQRFEDILILLIYFDKDECFKPAVKDTFVNFDEIENKVKKFEVNVDNHKIEMMKITDYTEEIRFGVYPLANDGNDHKSRVLGFQLYGVSLDEKEIISLGRFVYIPKNGPLPKESGSKTNNLDDHYRYKTEMLRKTFGDLDDEGIKTELLLSELRIDNFIKQLKKSIYGWDERVNKIGEVDPDIDKAFDSLFDENKPNVTTHASDDEPLEDKGPTTPTSTLKRKIGPSTESPPSKKSG
ncbi:dhc-1 [Acrasis kona]|uniref:Dhc-1 n=1 Tax=Acrasis kona TaxID=1008807 RepID=A0AAW2YJE6_9EUKA